MTWTVHRRRQQTLVDLSNWKDASWLYRYKQWMNSNRFKSVGLQCHPKPSYVLLISLGLEWYNFEFKMAVLRIGKINHKLQLYGPLLCMGRAPWHSTILKLNFASRPNWLESQVICVRGNSSKVTYLVTVHDRISSMPTYNQDTLHEAVHTPYQLNMVVTEVVDFLFNTLKWPIKHH